MKEQRIWTIEKIREGFNSFYKVNGRYPTATEIDEYPGLPSSRHIQRTFGGLPAIRKKLGLSGQLDFSKGEYSSNRSKIIGERSIKSEKEVYKYLVDKFGQPFVHREYFFNEDRRTRTDFYVYHTKGTFSVDVFYPNSPRNMNLCVNSKLASYRELKIEYPVIFLVMNKIISQEQIDILMMNKKNKLADNQKVITFEQFKRFCDLIERAYIR